MPDNVAGLVYIAAFQPDAGENLVDHAGKIPPATKGITETSDGFLYLDPRVYAEDVAADVPAGEAKFMAHWTHLAPSGWYTDAVLMGTHLDGQGEARGDQVDISGYGAVASIEGGYPIVLAPGVRLEPQAQLVYQHINLHDVDDPFSHVAYDTPDALFGGIGVPLSADLLPLPYVLRSYLKANFWQDFTETDTIRFSGIHQVVSRHDTTTLELGGGIVAQISPSVGLWASAEYTTDIGSSYESRESVSGTTGLRVVW